MIWKSGAGKYPIQHCDYSSELTESGVAVSEACVFYGLCVKTDGVNDVVVTVYDNIEASGGSPLPKSYTFPGEAELGGQGPPVCVKMNNGIYVELTTGGTCSCIVYFDRG